MANDIAKTETAKKRRRKRRVGAIVGADEGGALDTGNRSRLARARELANQERHRIVAIGSAAAMGYARRSGMAQKMPSLPLVGPEGTLGLIAFAAAKMTKSKTLSHVATGLLAVAAHALGEGRNLTAPGPAAPVQGDDSVSGDETIIGEGEF